MEAAPGGTVKIPDKGANNIVISSGWDDDVQGCFCSCHYFRGVEIGGKCDICRAVYIGVPV